MDGSNTPGRANAVPGFSLVDYVPGGQLPGPPRQQENAPSQTMIGVDGLVAGFENVLAVGVSRQQAATTIQSVVRGVLDRKKVRMRRRRKKKTGGKHTPAMAEKKKRRAMKSPRAKRVIRRQKVRFSPTNVVVPHCSPVMDKQIFSFDDLNLPVPFQGSLHHHSASPMGAQRRRASSDPERSGRMGPTSPNPRFQPIPAYSASMPAPSQFRGQPFPVSSASMPLPSASASTGQYGRPYFSIFDDGIPQGHAHVLGSPGDRHARSGFSPARGQNPPSPPHLEI